MPRPKYTTTVRARMTPEQERLLDLIAARLGCTRSDVLRDGGLALATAEEREAAKEQK